MQIDFVDLNSSIVIKDLEIEIEHDLFKNVKFTFYIFELHSRTHVAHDFESFEHILAHDVHSSEHFEHRDS